MAFAIVILVVVTGLFWTKWYLDRPSFTILEVEKVLEIRDTKGKNATLLRIHSARCNHSGITEFWCRGISADGTISNIKIDDAPPNEQRTDAGDIQVCKRFHRPLKRGQKFRMTLSYDLTDSFPLSSETLIHSVGSATNKLRMVVTLPEARKAKAARAFLRYGGEIHKELPLPKITNRRIEIEISRLRLGSEYCLEWDW